MKNLKRNHAYECSWKCKCNKEKCLNFLIGGSTFSFPHENNFVIQRYEKKYKGSNKKHKDLKINMFGLEVINELHENTPVIEYMGELITKKEGDTRGPVYDKQQCNYLFDLNKYLFISKS